MNDQDDFQLANDPEPVIPKRINQEPKAKQRMLFSGLDCLPGQQDLFDTDGRE